MKKFSIESSLSPETIKQIIKNSNRNFMIKENGNQIVVSHPIWYRNDVAPNLYLYIQTFENGTKINGQFRMLTWVRVFMFFWFSFVGFVAIVIFFSILEEVRNNQKSISEMKFVLIPLGMITFGFGLIKFSEFLARNNTRKISRWFFDLPLTTKNFVSNNK